MMYDDLKKLLRERAGAHDEYDWHREIELKAADAIETLEHDNEVMGRLLSKQAAENARLRDALEASDKQFKRITELYIKLVDMMRFTPPRETLAKASDRVGVK